MKATDLFSLSTRMFRTNPSRTWLTILGISVGVGAVLFLVSLGYGLQNVILQKIVFNQALLSLLITPSTDLIVLDDKTIAEISQIQNVTDVTAMARFTGQLSMGGVNGTVDIRTANPSYFAYSGTEAKYGKLYEDADQNQILVSEAVLKLFGLEDPNEILGKQINVKIFTHNGAADSELEITEIPVAYTVKGIIDDSQESYAFLSLKEALNYVKINQYEQARVKVNDSKDLDLVKEEVIARGFQTQSLSETIEQANKIFNVIQIVLGAFGAVALAVSAIGMFNTMTVTLLERTNEIGIMRALGADKSNLR